MSGLYYDILRLTPEELYEKSDITKYPPTAVSARINCAFESVNLSLTRAVGDPGRTPKDRQRAKDLIRLAEAARDVLANPIDRKIYDENKKETCPDIKSLRHAYTEEQAYKERRISSSLFRGISDQKEHSKTIPASEQKDHHHEP